MQAILTLGDKDLDGKMDLNEFIQFVTEQEKKLWEVFSSLDADGNGMMQCEYEILVYIWNYSIVFQLFY